jgi:hypothetical protein
MNVKLSVDKGLLESKIMPIAPQSCPAANAISFICTNGTPSQSPPLHPHGWRSHARPMWLSSNRRATKMAMPAMMSASRKSTGRTGRRFAGPSGDLRKERTQRRGDGFQRQRRARDRRDALRAVGDVHRLVEVLGEHADDFAKARVTIAK